MKETHQELLLVEGEVVELTPTTIVTRTSLNGHEVRNTYNRAYYTHIKPV